MIGYPGQDQAVLSCPFLIACSIPQKSRLRFFRWGEGGRDYGPRKALGKSWQTFSKSDLTVSQ